MPEQIYLHRDYPYKILLEDGRYQNVELKDPKVLDLLSRLEAKMQKGYVVSQFIACQTEDGAYVVKYNGIAEDSADDGFERGVTPVAFFAKTLPDGQIQDAAYIQLIGHTFCRTPMILTKDGNFYYECNEYSGDSRKELSPISYIYKVNLNNLKYTLLTTCYYTSAPTVTCR